MSTAVRVAVSGGLTLVLWAMALPAQEKAAPAKGGPKKARAEGAGTPPADAEFTKFGIYESTAPRGRRAAPARPSCR